MPGPRRGSVWLLLLPLLLLAGCGSAQAAGTHRLFLPSLGREATATPRPPALVGQVLRGLGTSRRSLRAVVTGFATAASVGSPSGTLPAEGMFLIVFMDVTNEGPEADFINDSYADLWAEDALLRRFDLASGPYQQVAREAYGRGGALELIDPGSTIPTVFVFDVRPDSTDLRLGQWSTEPTPSPQPTATPTTTATATPTPTPTPTFPPTATPIAAQAGMAVAYQVGPGHDGHAAGTTVNPPLTRLWSVDLGGNVSYPLIAGGRVYATSNLGPERSGYGSKLHALDAQSGRPVWGPINVETAYFQSHAAYDAGRLFVTNHDGIVRAYAAESGALLWSQRVFGGRTSAAPPVAIQGVVYVTGEYLTALDEETGRVRWQASITPGGTTSTMPSLSSEGVALSSECQLTMIDRLTGLVRWTNARAGCPTGGWGRAVVYHANRVYRRGQDRGVFDARTGERLRGLTTDLPPAVTDRAVFTVSDRTLSALAPETGALLWNHDSAETLRTGPIAVGGWVYVGTASGTLLALDAASGQVGWSASLGSAIPPPIEDIQGQAMVANANAGEGLLVVPAGRTLTAYRGS